MVGRVGCVAVLHPQRQTTGGWRVLHHALDRARFEHTQLETEFKRLDAERQAQATHLRVEKAAREKLRMRTATPAVTLYLDAAGAPRAPVAASAASAPSVASGALR